MSKFSIPLIQVLASNPHANMPAILTENRHCNITLADVYCIVTDIFYKAVFDLLLAYCDQIVFYYRY